MSINYCIALKVLIETGGLWSLGISGFEMVENHSLLAWNLSWWFVWGFAHWTSENKSLLAWKQNLVVLDDRTAPFFEPWVPFRRSRKAIAKCPKSFRGFRETGPRSYKSMAFVTCFLTGCFLIINHRCCSQEGAFFSNTLQYRLSWCHLLLPLLLLCCRSYHDGRSSPF